MAISVRWQRQIKFTSGLILACAVLSGCNFRSSTRPSVLVLAIENLGFENVSCESDDLMGREFESFRQLCDEGVRFTHAYTTSTLSQPALASVFTGFYPLEHGVRSNGRDHLNAKIETVAERASELLFRTAFFSGGAPILRKSGLSQGFEVFDDNFPVAPVGLYRPAHELNRLFLSWIDRSVGPDPFFSALYFSDLQFPQATTRSDLGELRERSQDSQVKEVAESLGALFRELKQRGLWHRTHIVLMGLTGGSSSRSSEVIPMNLYAENTQVALFLKPARSSRDQGPQWTIDKNISLADVGRSLYELLGHQAPDFPLKELPRISLSPLIQAPKAEWSDDRLILVESSWGSWRWLSPPRYAARRQQYFYIHDAEPKIYNTLLDRLEQSPMPQSDPLWLVLDQKMVGFFNQLEIQPWKIQDAVNWSKYVLAQKWWSQKITQKGQEMDEFDSADPQSRRWRALRLLQQEDWAGLAQFAEQKKEPLYAFVAKRNLGQTAKAPGGSCGRLFRDKPLATADGCGDEMLEKIYDIATSHDRERRERLLESFIRRYNSAHWEQEVGMANYARHLMWDVSTNWPSGVLLVDLFLALPQYKNLKEEIKNRRLRENRAFDL